MWWAKNSGNIFQIYAGPANTVIVGLQRILHNLQRKFFKNEIYESSVEETWI